MSVRSHDAGPNFQVIARDPCGSYAVRAWAVKAMQMGVPVAVIEEALQRADLMDAHPVKRLPDADHLTEAERLQLEYQFDRRAWRSREAEPDVAIMLAERRGFAAAKSQGRRRG